MVGLLERNESIARHLGNNTGASNVTEIGGTSDRMKGSVNSTLAATLIATFVGVGAWLSGLAKAIWPGHPQIAAFATTIVVSVLVKQLWHANVGPKRV